MTAKIAQGFLAASVAAAAIVLLVGAGDATAQQDFYKGKTLTIGIGTSVGGSHDAYARIIANNIGRHIPGNPTVVPQNVPGAGSLTLANHVFESAPKDGTYIGALNRAAVFEELYTGKTTVRFDPVKMHWLGGPDTVSSVAIAWHTAKVKTAKDLLTHELIVGSSGGQGDSVPKLLSQTAGFKFKVILGYKSGGDVDLAIERGEVEGRATTAWGGLKQRSQDWMNEKKINMLYQTGLEAHPELKDIPLAVDFSRTPDDRKVAELFFAAEDIGYPYVAPPETPADRLAILRKAMEETFKDPQAKAEAAKQNLDINPVSWQRMTKGIVDSYSAPEPLRKRLRDTVNSGEQK
jgi:tripartite-type tricarboxylate transporter receptor subunit TctC